MQQVYLESFFKSGYRRFMKYISSIAHLVDEKVKRIIYRRLEVLEFFKKYGLPPTKMAYKVCRGTIFLGKRNSKILAVNYHL